MPRQQAFQYLGGVLSDLISFSIIYDWLRIWFRIANFAEDGGFACICLADDEYAKLRTLGADLCCTSGSLPKLGGVAGRLSSFVFSRHDRNGGENEY